jgi:hypothetical protein
MSRGLHNTAQGEEGAHQDLLRGGDLQFHFSDIASWFREEEEERVGEEGADMVGAHIVGLEGGGHQQSPQELHSLPSGPLCTHRLCGSLGGRTRREFHSSLEQPAKAAPREAHPKQAWERDQGDLHRVHPMAVHTLSSYPRKRKRSR